MCSHGVQDLAAHAAHLPHFLDLFLAQDGDLALAVVLELTDGLAVAGIVGPLNVRREPPHGRQWVRCTQVAGVLELGERVKHRMVSRRVDGLVVGPAGAEAALVTKDAGDVVLETHGTLELGLGAAPALAGGTHGSHWWWTR